MKSISFQNSILSALRGQFSPNQFGARLFMCSEDIADPNNYLVWFHERYHYLQSIFTPYGHLKWAAYRTCTSDIVNTWLSLSKEFKKDLRIPIAEYIDPNDYNSLRIASNVWFHNLIYQYYDVIEKGNKNSEIIQMLHHLSEMDICPEIEVQGQSYQLRGIDVLESFAKFEEAMMAELLTGKNLDESINPEHLNPEYFIALYYFLEQIGPERLIEFPIICELALGNAHVGIPSNPDEFRKYAPNWRFVHIINTIKSADDLPVIDFNIDRTFYSYANVVLNHCGYEAYEESWKAAEEYAMQSDLHMSEEMIKAIDYKKAHPWMLSYPMCSDDFISEDFNRFEPYFTITDDGVVYNTERITTSELLFEKHFQALSSQICGQISPYCQDIGRLMCGFSFTGANTCPHLLLDECDGHVDNECVLPEIVLDDHKNILRGCTFEFVLNSMGIGIKDINLGRLRSLQYKEIKEALDQYHKMHPSK